MSHNFKDLTGMTSGQLAVRSRAENSKNGHARWLCKCSCGNETIVFGMNLRRDGHTTSCGCAQKEAVSMANRTHAQTLGRVITSEYSTWMSMKERCRNANNTDYPSYGGRGIKVCPEWENSFETFLSDMGKKPFADAQIDRIDNDGGYQPSNCRWVTRKINARNKRTSRILVYNGQTGSLAEFAEMFNVEPKLLYTRLLRGWDMSRALTQPVK